MAVFNGHTVTKLGSELLGRALAGEGKFLFTRAAFGEERYEGNIEDLTDLVNKKLDCVISSVINDRGTAIVKVQLTNKNLETSFRTEEFGIYAKIDGDSQDVLYCYAAATQPDAIPNNSLGQTFEAEHNVYITLSSDTEAEIYIKEGAIFLTLEVANQQYVQTGGRIRGLLAGRTSLEEWGQYQANDGNWYLNVGGARNWNSENGNPDSQLKQITFLEHEKDLLKKQDKEDKTLPTNDKTIVGALKEIFNELWKKATTNALGRVKIGDTLSISADGTLNHRSDGGYKHIPSGGAAGQILKFLSSHTASWATPATLKFKNGNREIGTYNVTGSNVEIGLSPSDLGVLSKGSLPAGIPDAKGIYDLIEKGYGGQLDENLLYLNDQGVKQKDFLYFDRNKPGLFRCIQTTPADYVTNSTTYFVDASPASNADRLANLYKISLFNQNSFCFELNEIIVQGGIINLERAIPSKISYFNLIKPLTEYGFIYVSPYKESLAYYDGNYKQPYAAHFKNNDFSKIEVVHSNSDPITLSWISLGY